MTNTSSTNNSSNEIPEDIVYEEDQGADLIKKLRTKLKKCEQEKKEYLDGWQRLKADTLNNRKQQTDTIKVAQTRAVSEFVQNLLPALDSFDIALHSPTWESVDQVWRTGIEYVHTQLLTSLEGAGITVYGEEGELFDPNLHEAIGHEDGGQSGTLARIERRGYKTGTMVIRAAQVVVYN